jgi:hypothetical protein
MLTCTRLDVSVYSRNSSVIDKQWLSLQETYGPEFQRERARPIAVDHKTNWF